MQIGYILKEGFSGFRRAKLSMTAAIITITISLLLLSSFSILLINANSVIESLREKVEMEAFLSDAVSRKEADGIRAHIAALEGVSRVHFVSKEEAAEIFKEEFGEDIHRVLDFNPLPASLKIFLSEGYRTAAKAEAIYLAVNQIAGVEDVIYRKTLLEMLDRRAQTFLWVSLAIGACIAVSSIFLVANTIRLAIYAKRRIIQTMKLIGATRSFIRFPFIIEGLFQGVIGGLLAAGILFVIFEYLLLYAALPLEDFLKVDPLHYGVIVGVGSLLGLLGSIISIRRFIGERVVTE
ncbi:MAG: ABC transporter permease [Ignavibacteria bacterium]|nr:ABC transporter permease [Ignavibacteria bacterium]